MPVGDVISLTADRVGSLESMRASHAGVVIRAGSDRSNGVVAGGDGTEI